MPDLVPAPGKWNRPPRRRLDLRPTILPAFAAGQLLVFVPLLIVLGSHDAKGSPKGAIFAMVAFYGGVALYGTLVTWFALRADPEDRRLLEDHADADVALVQIAVVRDGKTVGRDRGAAWFEGGRLLFSGHATSFALGGEDRLPAEDERRVYRQGRGDGGPLLPDLAVPLRVPEGWAYVQIEPLHGHDPLGDKRDFRFVKRFAEFRKHPPRSQGPRQLPPLSPPNRGAVE